MQTILVPVDGSAHALKALHIGCDLAEKYGGRIALLHVLAKHTRASNLLALKVSAKFSPKLRSALQTATKPIPGKSSAVELSDSVIETAGKEILDLAASGVRRRSLEAEVLPLATGAPSEAILLAQKRTGANTIVMGCRGVASDSEAGSFGSVSNAVFARAPCTCLSVK